MPVFIYFLEKPVGLSNTDNVLNWNPNIADAGKVFPVSIEIDNGYLKDTISFDIRVLDDNEFAELPDADLVWDADTIKVYQNLLLRKGRTLTIMPGVFIEFQDHYKISIEGRLLAQAEADNLFTAC